MSADELATLLRAQRTGPRRWKAQCPAHQDRTPSLSITEGDDGRVLLWCFAGCSLDSILSALRLTMRDLFAGPPPTPEQSAMVRAAAEARKQSAQRARRSRLEALNRLERIQAAVNILGAKLARSPNDDGLAALFEQALQRQHLAQIEVERLYPVRQDGAYESDRLNDEHDPDYSW